MFFEPPSGGFFHLAGWLQPPAVGETQLVIKNRDHHDPCLLFPSPWNGEGIEG
jgi:hypothetical protein